MNYCPLFPNIYSDSFILVSSSPRRKELLATVGLNPLIMKPDTNEELLENESFANYLQRVTQDKATVVLNQLSNNDKRCVLSADTVVILNHQLLQKPKNKTEAIEMLTKLCGKTHLVRTGFCVARSKNGSLIHKYDFQETKITLRNLATEKIASYVETKEPMDKAGAYGAQGIGSLLIDKIEGSYDTVVGLPVFASLQLISTCID